MTQQMIDALTKAREQFLFYEKQHFEKGTEESYAKAAVNADMAEMCLQALKGSSSILRTVPFDVRPDPECHYEVKSPDRPEKVCQNYSQSNNLELSSRIVNLIAPHWNQHVRNVCADTVRYFLGDNLTRMWCDIVDFHHKFRLTYQGPPRMLPDDLGDFRGLFMVEELEEYLDLPKDSLVDHAKALVAKRGPIKDTINGRVDRLDALVDLVYVALGTAYLHGFNFAEAWRRVQRANMSKVRAERADQSKRGSTFDVVKPEGWKAPDHTDLVGVLDDSYIKHLQNLDPAEQRRFLEGEFINDEPKGQHDLF